MNRWRSSLAFATALAGRPPLAPSLRAFAAPRNAAPMATVRPLRRDCRSFSSSQGRFSSSKNPPSSSPPSSSLSSPSTGPATAAVVQKSLWGRVKAEVRHYWLGTKLLAYETRISTRLLWKLMRGTKLTRREHTQLVRTAKDLFRLIPFSIFVIVPFMEFLLPVALRLFPNMLPSTYTDKEKEEAKRRQLMSSKLNMAKFLRDSISETAVNSGPQAIAAQEFAGFFKKYRTSGERASTAEILVMCKKFSDDLTLDNLSRPQLVTLSNFMGVNAFGTDNFIRYVLRRRMQEIKRDDKMIESEGIDSLTVSELLSACQARGIRTLDVHPDQLRYELQQWLDLNIKNEIPPTLLILSRALMMTDRPAQPADTAEALQTTLTSLPDEAVEEAEMRISEAEGVISFQKKLEIIRKEEDRIATELAEAKSTKHDVDVTVAEAQWKGATSQQLDVRTASGTTAAHENGEEEESAKLTSEQFRELGETLSVISSNTEKEREQLQELKEDRLKLEQQDGSTPADTRSDKTKKRQLKELDELISEVEEYLDAMEGGKGAHEEGPGGGAEGKLARTISTDLQGNITTAQLETVLKMIRHPPDETRIKAIVKKLDTDGDGRIFLKEILELSEELGESEGKGVVVERSSGKKTTVE